MRNEFWGLCWFWFFSVILGKKYSYGGISDFITTINIVFISRDSKQFCFHLGDHISITRQALAEFDRCFPGQIDKDEPFFVISSDVEEDLNVVRKDLVYSHYFNPQKDLNMKRLDSMARVDGLSEALKNDKNSVVLFIHLGHVIHHIQDMAAPVHVVPIFHGPFDSFEKYDLKNPDISTGISCQALESQALKMRDLSDLLIQSAQQTLKAISDISLMISADDSKGSRTYPIDGTAFWKAGVGNEFGDYGSMGKHFGETEIEFSNGKVKAPADFYESFKKNQLRAAVIHSWMALYYFHQPSKKIKRVIEPMDSLTNFYGLSLEGILRAFSLSGF